MVKKPLEDFSTAELMEEVKKREELLSMTVEQKMRMERNKLIYDNLDIFIEAIPHSYEDCKDSIQTYGEINPDNGTPDCAKCFLLLCKQSGKIPNTVIVDVTVFDMCAEDE